MPFLFNCDILDDGEETSAQASPFSRQGQVAGRVVSCW